MHQNVSLYFDLRWRYIVEYMETNYYYCHKCKLTPIAESETELAQKLDEVELSPSHETNSPETKQKMWFVVRVHKGCGGEVTGVGMPTK